jgi:hypothetical protein
MEASCDSNQACNGALTETPTIPPTPVPTVSPSTPVPTVSPSTSSPTSHPSSQPTSAVSCSSVNISDWQNNNIRGNEITSVTIGGLPARIVSQTENNVMILNPTNTQLANNVVVVTTEAGDVATLTHARTSYILRTYTDFENWKSMKLPAGIWSNAGSVPWRFIDDPWYDPNRPNGEKGLFNVGAGTNDDFFDLRWMSASSSVGSQGGCASVATRIKFAYKTYSGDLLCYDKFQVLVQQNNQPTWSVIWNGQIGSNAEPKPWFYADIILPSQTTGLSIYVKSSNYFPGCWSVAPGEIVVKL